MYFLVYVVHYISQDQSRNIYNTKVLRHLVTNNHINNNLFNDIYQQCNIFEYQ